MTKDNANIFSNFILKNFNKCIIEGKFPDQLKKADVSPVFKNGNHNDKTNYRPVSILPLFWKIYERLIYNQVNHMTENALSVFLCGFRKKYSTQHTLIAMTEKARKTPDKGGTFRALLTDLSKGFDCMTWPSYSKAPCTELWYECTQLDIWWSDRKKTKSQN